MSVLDWIYPPKCMACKQILPIQEMEWRRFRLCEKCRALFERIPPPACEKCGRPLEEETGGCPSCFGKSFAFTGNQSAFIYEGVLRDILMEVKFHSGKQSVIGLGELWASVLTDSDFSDAGSIFAPVPMYAGKVRERGFNQAEILADSVAKKYGADMKKDLLIRTVNTPPQSGLTARGRAENVRGVFKVNDAYNIEGKNIILIDDIFTTGASLNACAEILKESGAENVACMTLAIAVHKKENTRAV